MGTEVLRPQDCLIQRVRISPAFCGQRRRNHGHGFPTDQRPTTNNSAHTSNPRKSQRRRSPDVKIPRRSASTGDLRTVRSQNKQLVVENVKILKRGEGYKPENMKWEDDMALCGTGRLGPAPDMLPKLSPINTSYAGSAFFLSPSPRSLPLPSFFSNKKMNPVDDSATKDLRRLLRLDC